MKRYGKERNDRKLMKEPEEEDLGKILENVKMIEREVERKKLERENVRKLQKEQLKPKERKLSS